MKCRKHTTNKALRFPCLALREKTREEDGEKDHGKAAKKSKVV